MLDLDVDRKRLQRILTSAHEQNPQDFETLLGLQGVGPATVRSLSLLAEIIFQAPPSHRDPTVSKHVGNDAGHDDAHVAGSRAAGPTTRTPTAARTARRFPWTGTPTTATSPS